MPPDRKQLQAQADRVADGLKALRDSIDRILPPDDAAISIAVSPKQWSLIVHALRATVIAKDTDEPEEMSKLDNILRLRLQKEA